MKKTLKIDLPDRDAIVRGLTPHELHPALSRAEQAVTEAEHNLDRARAELVDRDRQVAELPARITAGAVKTSALTEALRERDAAALLVPPVEAALAKARDRVATEAKAAGAAVQREFLKRAEQLERSAAELSQVLEVLGELADTLGVQTLSWPDSPATRGFAVAAARAGHGPLTWAPSPEEP